MLLTPFVVATNVAHPKLKWTAEMVLLAAPKDIDSPSGGPDQNHTPEDAADKWIGRRLRRPRYEVWTAISSFDCIPGSPEEVLNFLAAKHVNQTTTDEPARLSAEDVTNAGQSRRSKRR